MESGHLYSNKNDIKIIIFGKYIKVMKNNVSPYGKPHRRLLLSSGDIILPKDAKLRTNQRSQHISLKSQPKNDKLYSFKEECMPTINSRRITSF